MSVLACDRAGCNNIMCDRFSPEYQAYLCENCFEELVSLGFRVDIRIFLDSEPEPNTLTATRAYFQVLFPLSGT